MSGYGGGLGGGFGFGASMNMLGGYGHMGGHSMEPDFGVIATLNIQGGANAFKINGLGPFTRIGQLAGRGVLVSRRSGCSDGIRVVVVVVVGVVVVVADVVIVAV